MEDKILLTALQFSVKYPACQTDGERYSGVSASEEQEADKVARIPMTNAGADPGAVMVVRLDADATRTAME